MKPQLAEDATDVSLLLEGHVVRSRPLTPLEGYEPSRNHGCSESQDPNKGKGRKTMSLKIVWATPLLEACVGYIARVSNPSNQNNDDIVGLLRYMLRNGHVSPFEMAHVCVEINTTRDIGRQILRHRSFSFQEFSGRYQSYEKLDSAGLRDCRLQDRNNRQSSFETNDRRLKYVWEQKQRQVLDTANEAYKWALDAGIAKEQARALLPEGLTPTRLYMVGSMRSWIHYLRSRLDQSTQKEHRDIAQGVQALLRGIAPVIMEAAEL